MKTTALFQEIQATMSSGLLSNDLVAAIALSAFLERYNRSSPGKISTVVSLTPVSMLCFTISLVRFDSVSEHMTWRSLTRARKSPGLLLTNSSKAPGSAVNPSSLITRNAIRLSASFDALSNLIVTKCLEKRSLAVLQDDEVLPHKPISSLQAKITGCRVFDNRFNNSALPPLSPFSALESSISSPETIDEILSAETSLRPPER